MEPRRVTINLQERSYDILIGKGLIANPGSIIGAIRGKRCALVTNTTVGPLYGNKLQQELESQGISCVRIDLPDGEEFKTWESLQLIFDQLMVARCERSTTLIALGGGVVGDIAGFAAACYQRGMPFIQIPTTLLAQVDSSVGGKTAINHPLGKNMIGAFYQPKLVVADIAALHTLPPKELRAGLAEIIKYGLIRDSAFFEWLELHLPDLLGLEPDYVAEAVVRSCQHKAEIVAADERESGIRALLNLGHTFGHAIETGMGYGSWLHGEAVAAGTLVAAEVSVRLGWLNRGEFGRIEGLFGAAGLPVKCPPMSVETYLELMQHDKKVQDGKIQFVLLKGIGNAVTNSNVPEEVLRAALSARIAQSSA